MLFLRVRKLIQQYWDAQKVALYKFKKNGDIFIWSPPNHNFKLNFDCSVTCTGKTTTDFMIRDDKENILFSDSIAIWFAFVLQAKVYALCFSVLSTLVKYISEFLLWFKTSTISVRVFSQINFDLYDKKKKKVSILFSEKQIWERRNLLHHYEHQLFGCVISQLH